MNIVYQQLQNVEMLRDILIYRKIPMHLAAISLGVPYGCLRSKCITSFSPEEYEQISRKRIRYTLDERKYLAERYLALKPEDEATKQQRDEFLASYGISTYQMRCWLNNPRVIPR